MKTTIEFGKIDYHNRGQKENLVTIEMELKDTDKGPVFSASANVWNRRQTDIEMGGQCLDSIYEEFKDQIDNPTLFDLILTIWKDNHLNDMHAGTIRQESILNAAKANGWKYEYTEARDILESHNLLIDDGYEYGTAWLYQPIPDSVLGGIRRIIEKSNAA